MTTATLSPGSAKVKFRLAGGAQPLILLPTQVNGDGPFDFILDTGAGTSFLSSELAKKLNIKIHQHKRRPERGWKNFGIAGQGRFARRRTGKDRGRRCWHCRSRSHLENDRHENRWRYRLQFPENISASRSIITMVRFGSMSPRRIEHFGRSSKTEVPMRLASLAKPLLLVDVHANWPRTISIRDRYRHIDHGDCS